MSNSITNDFDPISAAAWKQKIQFELNGADYNKTLLTQTIEGITVKPFYHPQDFEKLKISYSNKTFNSCKYLIINSEIETNINAQNTIKQGVNVLKFEASTPFDSAILFKNLLNKNIVFHFNLRFFSAIFIQQLIHFLKSETVFINIDIIGKLAKTGNWYHSLNEDFNSIEKLIQQNPTSKILCVNAQLYQNAGANTVQQIAYALAHANEYFQKFGGEIANHISFNFSIGSNFFFEIAKLRAFRYLLNLILNEYQCSAEAHIFTEPSYRNKTINNKKLNLLRLTTESLSAILGGANTIANQPFNIILEDNSINQLLILQESNLLNNYIEIVNDQYYIEALTKQIAEKALQIFKEIEKGGGFLAQLKQGVIQRKIAENAKKEQDEFNLGTKILVGSNKYLHQDEQPTLNLHPFLEKKLHKTLIIPIIPKRLSEKLEQKKLKNEA